MLERWCIICYTKYKICNISIIVIDTGTRPYFRTTVNMCKKDEYYLLETGECLPCSECPKGDSVIFKCHYFGDTVCEKDVFKGLIMDFPTPNPSLVTRGPGTVAVEVPGTVAVEVLPEDWTTSPTLLTVITAVCFTTLMITIVIALYCIRRKMCHPKHEKEILYLSRRKCAVVFFSHSDNFCFLKFYNYISELPFLTYPS